MLRRRIFAYSVLYAAGVASGYLFFECNKYLLAFILLVSLALITRWVDTEYRPQEVMKERLILIAILLIGFSLFTLKYIEMHRAVMTSDGKPIEYQEISKLEGIIKKITIKNSDNGTSYKLVISPTSLKGTGDVQVSYYQELADAYSLAGTEATFYGKFELADLAMNPGCFNYRTYLYSKNISHVMTAKLIKLAGRNDSLYWRYIRKSNYIRESFLDQFDDVNRGFIKGVIFGDKSDIDEEIVEEFNTNSTGHILAVSGLHVGFLFGLLKALSGRKKSKWISVLIGIILFMYGQMTGWSASTMRAVIILGLGMIARYVRKPIDLLSLISTASIIILTHNPYQLINSGFQMSFLALLGIAFLTKPLGIFFGETLGTMFSIQLTIIPITAFSFNGINLMAMFINIPIVFLASILVPTSIIGLICVAITGVEPKLLTLLIEKLSSFIVYVNNHLSCNQFFYINVKGMNPGAIVLIYIILFFIASEWVRIKLLRRDKKRILQMIPFLIFPCLCIGIATYNTFINDEVVFVSVGQGDCTHIRSAGHNILIDGGGARNYNTGKNTLKPYLLKNGALNLDVALATHMHMDHYKGIEELNNVFPIGTIEIGKNVSIREDVYIEAIWPLNTDKLTFTTNDANENNVVYLVHYNKTKILVTGDLLAEDEKRMVEHYRNRDTLKCDVLKVGHHGSRSSTTDELLDAVNPSIAVISVGKNNTYGHPHQETLDKLAARGIKIYRTDLNGAVGIDIKKNGIKVDTLH